MTEKNIAYSGQGVLLRFYWSAIGPLLGLSLWWLSWQDGALGTVWDVAYVVAVVSMIAARVLEQREPGATTLYGDPITKQHLWRYGIIVGSFGVAGAIVAHVF